MVELSCQCPLNIHRTGFILNRINFIQLDIIAHPISRTSFEAVYVTKQCCSICSANVIRFSCAFVESIHSRFQIKRHRFEVEIDWNIKREQLYDDDDNDDSIKSVSVASSCGIYLNVVAHNIDSACTQLQATAHDFPFIIFKYNVKASKLLLNNKYLFSNSHHKLVTLSIYVEFVVPCAFRIFFSLQPKDSSMLLNVLLDLFSKEWRLEPVHMFVFVPLIWIQLHLPALQMLSSTSSLISWSNFSALQCKHFAGSKEGNFRIV